MSAGILDKLKYIVGFEEINEDEDDFIEVRGPEQEEPRPTTAPQYQREPIKERDAKVVNFQQKPQMKLIVHEPASFDDCSKIVDNLKNKKPVIMNLEKIETEIAKRIFDFVSGATYAIDGSVQKVSNNIFVFAPDNVDIASNIEEFKTLTSANLFK